MTRVVFVTTSYPRTPSDPAGHFVETEARLRALRGDRVTVLAPGPIRRTTAGGVHVEWLGSDDAFGPPGALERLRQNPLRTLAAARFARAARRRLADLAPDEIVAHWLVPSAWPIALGLAPSVEVVVHGSDVGVLERMPGAARRWIVRGCVRRGARFRFVSHELRDRLVRATGPELLTASCVEPSPIDVGGAPDRAAARARLGVGGERLAVIVGRLVAGKRPGEAVRLALAEGADRVVVVGDGPLAAATRAAFPGVELRGALPRSDALAWIAAADLLVSASRQEGAPTVVREARALGVPVVAAPSGDLREWARNDPGIRLVDP